MDNNIVIASFGRFHEITTDKIWQYDYGMKLVFDKLDLPHAFTVHFSNKEFDGEALCQTGEANTVDIPDELLLTGMNVYAWVYLHTGEGDGETVYKAKIPVQKRAKPIDEPPTPVQRGYVDIAVEALDKAMEQAESIETNVKNAEAWAVGKRGGVDVGEGDDTYRNNSAYYADLARQAAGTAGYFDIYIDDNGDLVYTRTESVNIDFELHDGYLIMEVI